MGVGEVKLRGELDERGLMSPHDVCPSSSSSLDCTAVNINMEYCAGHVADDTHT